MLYIQDRKNHTLAVLENYYDDLHSKILESGVSSYKFSIAKSQKGADFLIRGNYLVLDDDNGQGWKFTIITAKETHGVVEVESEDLGLELLNKVRNSWISPGSAKPLKYYFDKATRDTGWQIGINEISSLTRTLVWDGRDTALKRLLSIASQFDNAELEFKVEFKNLQVTKQIVNIYKKRGASRADIQLVYGDSVNDIRKTSDITELATALQGVGDTIQKDKPIEGEPDEHVTFSSLTYDDGEYFTPTGDPFLYARTANQQFNLSDNYLEDFYDFDTQSPQELLNRTLTQLKSRCEPKVNYEVDLAKVDASLNLGDTVTIVDHDYMPKLLLNGRVLQLEKSYTDPSKNKVTLGNYLILYSTISDKLKKLQEQLKIIKPKTTYVWLRYAKDDQGNGMSAVPTADTKYFAMLVNKITAVPSDDPADYAGHWQLIQGQDGAEGIPGKPGADGKTSYTHFAYANNVSGTADFSLDNPTGRSYMGVYSDFTKADSTNPDDYIWSLTKGSDGKDGVRGLQGADGKDGIPGKAGTDGKTSYTHIAYANSADGVTNFSTSDSNRTYIGMYVDFNVNDSTTPGDYSWTLVKGADGSQGTPGKPGSDGKTPYLHTAYSWSADGTDRFMTVYPNENQWSDKKVVPSYIAAGTGIPTKSIAPDATMLDPVTVPSTATKLVLTIYNPNKLVNTANTAKPSLFKGDTYLGFQSNFSLTGDTVQKKEWSIPAGATKAYLGTVLGAEHAESFDFSIKTKYEFDTATPYTPSPSDDPEGAYPQFIGTYTDYTTEDSTDPSKYTWAKLRGEQGQKGDTGEDGVAGKDGVGIKSTAVTYQASTSGTTAPTGAWLASPTAIAGQYQWTRTVWTYTDGTTEVGYSVGHIGADGNDGANGVAGKDGVGIKSTTITYASSTSGTTAPTSGWVATPPSAKAGQFVWTRTIWTYTDNTTETGYSVGKIGEKGDNGADGKDGANGIDGVAGKDGIGIKSTIITYQLSSSGTTTPTGTWSTTVPALTKGQYLWTRTTLTYTDNTTKPVYSVSYVAKDGNNGSDGLAGKDGVGIKTTTITYQSGTSGTVQPTGTWVSSPPSVPDGNYLWTKTVWSYTDNTSETGYSVAKAGEKGDKGDKGDKGATGADGLPGKDGVSVESTVVTYQLGTSGTTKPTNTWSSTVPTLVKGQYLWTKTTWNYSDRTSEDGYQVTYIGKDGNNGSDGLAGKDGVGIKTTTIAYQSGTSGTVQPTGTWVANPPSVPGGQYLWTRTVWSYTDGTSETGYSVAKAGEKGDKGDKGLQGDNGKDGVAGKDGVGIKSTSVTYQASASGTTAPTGTWVASPTAIAGQYQWTRTVWTYTDGTTEVGYSVGHIGADGATGKDGLAGKDGVGITSTLIEYVGAVSGTSEPTSGWSTTIPAVPAGQYLWTRTTWQYTDGTSEQGFTNALMGRTGAAGKDGSDGKDGVDGKDGAPGSKDVPVTTVSAAQPTTAKNGDIWWVLNSADVATAMKVYTSGAWVDKKVDQSVLNIVTLNAVTINGSTINGSEFNTSYTGVLADGQQGSSQQTLDNTGYSQTSTFYRWDDSQIVTRSEIDNIGRFVTGFSSQAEYNPSQPWANNIGSIYLDPINLYIGFTGADLSGDYYLSVQDAYQNSGSATYLNGWGSWNADYSLKVVRHGQMVTVWGYIKHNNSATITPFAQVPAWARPEQGILISAVTFNSKVGNPIASALVMNAETGRIGFNSGGQNGGYVCFSTTYVGGLI